MKDKPVRKFCHTDACRIAADTDTHISTVEDVLLSDKPIRGSSRTRIYRYLVKRNLVGFMAYPPEPQEPEK
jgi:hypothetical protein